MTLRTKALCDGKTIGIEEIYTVINDKQINIPTKLIELRCKSRENRLFCPCGCGANLELVAGERMLREQHFRIKKDSVEFDCSYHKTGRCVDDSNSRIVLKCWMADKLDTQEIRCRVPINTVDKTDRKYEFSFLDTRHNLAICYIYDRTDFWDEKIDILSNNNQSIRVLFIIDEHNSNNTGQLPEKEIKIQTKQGYCLLLSAGERDYYKARLKIVFYEKNLGGIWSENIVIEGLLRDFSFNNNCDLIYSSKTVDTLANMAKEEFADKQRKEMERRKSQEKRKLDEIRRITAERQSIAEGEKPKEQGALSLNYRIITCKYCGLIASDVNFPTYDSGTNIGICKDCLSKPEIQEEMLQDAIKKAHEGPGFNENTCPKCGRRLVERNGRYGKFMGCSGFPECRYSI